MLHEYRDIITHMKADGKVNSHFLKIFDRHNDLDNQIIRAEHGSIAMTSLEIEKLKKEKLRLKDEAHHMIVAYKKDHNL